MKTYAELGQRCGVRVERRLPVHEVSGDGSGVPLVSPETRARIELLKRQKAEIEQFVFTLPNTKLRRIVTLRTPFTFLHDIMNNRGCIEKAEDYSPASSLLDL